MREVTLDVTRVHRLGRRAFLLFLSKRMKLSLVFLSLAIIAWFSKNKLPAEYAGMGEYAWKGAGLLFLAIFLLEALRTFMEYRRHTYTFEEEAFTVHKGYVVRNEIAIVYHQIQNVNIKRDMLDRMLGVSQIVIVMVGSSDGLNVRQADTTLLAIDHHKAKLIQKELLRRARRHLYRVADPLPAAAPLPEE
jgi:uncharacterized membrane protein YdbT with pleckstrin-like domain